MNRETREEAITAFNCRLTESEDITLRRVLVRFGFGKNGLKNGLTRDFVVSCAELLDSGDVTEQFKQYLKRKTDSKREAIW